MSWQGYFEASVMNAGIALVLVILYGFVERALRTRPRYLSTLRGVLFGAMTLIALVFTVEVVEGVIHDARNILILLSAMFGGPVSGGITYLIAMAYRTALGGAGVWVAWVAGGANLAVGLGGYYLVRKRGRRWTLRWSMPVILLAFVALDIALVSSGVAPPEVIRRSVSAITTVYFPAAVLFAFLLQRAEDQVALENRLVVSDRVHNETPVPQFWTDVEGAVTWRNPAAAEQLGLDVGDDWSSILEESSREMIDPVRSLRDGEQILLDVMAKTATGEGHHGELLVFRSRPDPAADPVLCFNHHDLHELVVTQGRLQAALDAKDRFIAGVAHQLRTPAAEVFGSSELLTDLNGGLDEDGRRELMRLMAAGGITLSDVISDLTVAAQLPSGAIEVVVEEVDPSTIVRSILQLHPSWDFEVVRDTDDLTASADPTRVRQIIRNLMTNAVAHGGSQLRVRLSRSHDRVEVHVCDDGDGLPPGIDPFEPYETTGHSTGDYPALGLGLWVSQSLAEAMDSKVTYLHDGEWAHFILSMPATAPEPITA